MTGSRPDELRKVLRKLAFQVRARSGDAVFSSPSSVASVSAPKSPPRGPSCSVRVASGCVSSAFGSVPVASSLVPVASRGVVASGCVEWRSVASESVPPRIALRGAIENARRAARALKSERMAERLAGQAPEPLLRVPEDGEEFPSKWLM